MINSRIEVDLPITVLKILSIITRSGVWQHEPYSKKPNLGDAFLICKEFHWIVFDKRISGNCHHYVLTEEGKNICRKIGFKTERD